eukprot:1695373-Alexandrium_andersonii.AAC.1
MDVAAFDYNFQPEFGLEEYAKEMVCVDTVRRRNGTPRTLPSQYLSVDVQPQYAPEQISVLRRANCRRFFPQHAQWHSELSYRDLEVCRQVSMSVTIALRHFGRLPKGALSFEEVPYGMDSGGWVLTTHLVDMCWQNLRGPNKNYNAFKDLLVGASEAFN